MTIQNKNIIAAIDREGELAVAIFNPSGQQVFNINTKVAAGYFAIPFQPENGLYLVKMEHTGRVLTNKFLMVR
jgi:hypothetical protein